MTNILKSGYNFNKDSLGVWGLLDYFRNMNFKDIVFNILNFIGIGSPVDVIRAVIDIGIVSYFIYKIFVLIRETRAIQLIKGVIAILIASYLSKWLGLRTIDFILSNSLQLIGFTVIVLFQPELRRGLEQIGRSKFSDIFSFDESSNIQTTALIEEVVRAVVELSKTYTGALIVFERNTKIGEIIDKGIKLDSSLTAELLLNIFTPNTPLHDGAVVIGDNRIKAASCILPLTDNPNLSKELGTRHRAALGITEISDSFAVVVSEETGKISVALNGGLTRNLTPDTLRKALNKNLLTKNDENKKRGLWKVKSK